MPRQILNRGAAPFDVTADSVYVGAGKLNEMTAELYAGAGSAKRYVALNGNDETQDGLTWASPKLTIKGAMDSLPTQVVNSQTVPYGHIEVGAGEFFETGPLKYGSSFVLRGQGCGTSARHTRIAAQTDNSSHLFECVAAASDGHGTLFEHVVLRGHSVAQPTQPYDVIVMNGGYNALLHHVAIQNASRWGVQVKGGFMNVLMCDTTFSGCGSTTQGGAIWLNGVTAGGQISLLQSQIDVCGVNPIRIEQSTVGQGRSVSIRDVKMEAQVGVTLHEHPIYIVPSTSGDPIQVLVENLYCNNYATGWSTDMFEAVVYETTGTGPAARVRLLNVWGDNQYQFAFKSAKTGITSVGKRCLDGSFRGTETPVLPLYEANGIGIYTGAGAPGSLTAPNGSEYHRTDGSGTTDNLYIRRGAAWVGIA